jgi:D-alanyl-D-alanine carboxypeptidase (penicillin-binding protein 5/6)
VSDSGAVLWSKESNARRKVASCIKLLTALVVRDEADLDDVITVTSKASSMYNGTVGLRKGQKLTVRQLLEIMLVHSANDAAEALAVGIAGKESKFVAMMNAKAKKLKLRHTHATDPHGLGKKEHSSARDLSVLGRYVLADPVLRRIVSKGRVSVPRGNGRSETYRTTNRLLGVYPGMEGIKTGYTNPAGRCFVGAAKRDGVRLICVVLGAGSGQDRFSQTRKLLDWGFAHVEEEEVISREQTMGVIEVPNGSEPKVTVHADKPITMTVLDNGTDLTTKVRLKSPMPAPVSAGQKLGVVEIVSRGSVVATAALCADRAVAAKRVPSPASESASANEKLSLWQRISLVWAHLGQMIGG